MILKLKSIPLILLIALSACNIDPDPPIPDGVHSYFNLYNFFNESYGISWEINELLVESEHTYGVSFLQSIIMEEEAQDITITAKQFGSEQVLGSVVYKVSPYQYYSVFLLGKEQVPRLLIEPMDLNKPSPGMIKLQFLHASLDLGSVDIYIGGDTPEHKAVSGVPFAQLTEYMESTEEKLWESIVITPIETSPADSTILSYKANNAFHPNQVYLGVIGHVSNAQTSSPQLILYEQPFY